MAQETVGALIRRLRGSRSQTEIADRADIPRASLAGIETDRVDRPGIDKLQRLAAVLEVHPNTLLRAAGYRVGEPPAVKPKTLSDILMEAARKARELESRDDAESRRELRSFASFFSRPLALV